MSTRSNAPDKEEIARVAYAIWEAEGQPMGRDHEHWMLAKHVVEEGRAEIDYPQATAGTGAEPEKRPVQAGFEGAAPGMTSGMKRELEPDESERPRGRFARQLSALPESAPKDPAGRP